MDFLKYIPGATLNTAVTTTTQGTGATITTPVTSLGTAYAGASGAALNIPANGAAGNLLVVRNGAGTNAVNVFPPSGGAFNLGTANAAFSLAAAKTAIFVALDNTGLNWATVLTA